MWWFIHYVVLDDIISFSWKLEVHLLLSYVHILDFNFVECFGFSTCPLIIIFFWNNFMFYVARTSCFIIKKINPRGTKMERRNPRYFSLMSHPSFIQVYILILLLWIRNIWFNVHCSWLTTHALTFSSYHNHLCCKTWSFKGINFQ
jgi:hypothetical protein